MPMLNRVPKIVRFAFVGISGVIPNLACLWLLTEILGLHYVPAMVLATQAGVAWNFVLTDYLVFPERKNRSLWGRAWRFVIVGNMDMLARIPLTVLLVEGMRWNPVVAAGIVIATIFVVKWLLVSRLIWHKNEGKKIEEDVAVAG